MKSVSIIATSFFFSAFGDRLWNFAVGLYLVKLTPESLQLAAIYGLVSTGIAILFSPVIGDWIDHNDRLVAVRTLLVLQNVFVILCASFILIYLYDVTSSYYWLKVMQAIIILFGSSAYLSGVGEKISVSKDWVVVVCGQNKDILAKTNALLRRIDLSAAVLAPIGVGFLMTVISDLAGIILIFVWNVITMFGEYFLLHHLYHNDPHLRHKALVNDIQDVAVTVNSFSSREKTAKSSSNLNFLHRFKMVLAGWKVYQRQHVFLAGTALAWLYLTVLGFNEVTTSYAYSQGLKEVFVSICFGLGSVSGIVGTFLFPLIRMRIGLSKTGIVGNIIQLSMLSMCVISIWLPGSPSSLFFQPNKNNTSILIGNCTQLHVNSSQNITCNSSKINRDYTSILVFMAGIILSRTGLWIADLTITQLQQEYVCEEERGTVGGVQYAFNSIFNLLHYIVTICLPSPSQFWILILMSMFAVTTSFGTYIIFNIRFKRRTFNGRWVQYEVFE